MAGAAVKERLAPLRWVREPLWWMKAGLCGGGLLRRKPRLEFAVSPRERRRAGWPPGCGTLGFKECGVVSCCVRHVARSTFPSDVPIPLLTTQVVAERRIGEGLAAWSVRDLEDLSTGDAASHTPYWLRFSGDFASRRLKMRRRGVHTEPQLSVARLRISAPSPWARLCSNLRLFARVSSGAEFQRLSTVRAERADRLSERACVTCVYELEVLR